MKLTPKQQQERDAILADMEAMRLRVNALFTPPAAATWPQRNDFYLYASGDGLIYEQKWGDYCTSDKDRISIGNVVHPSKRAELERHVEALKVHHELRSMSGRTAPPDGGERYAWGILSNDGGNSFTSVNYSQVVAATMALGGVWFSSKESCDNAIKAISQSRLVILYDDFLQTPMGDK